MKEYIKKFIKRDPLMAVLINGVILGIVSTLIKVFGQKNGISFIILMEFILVTLVFIMIAMIDYIVKNCE